MEILISWIILSVAVYITAYVIPGVAVAGIFATILTAMFIGIVNAVLRPILIFLTLPVNILTLGLFTFVINALLIMLVAAIVPGFTVDNFWWALAFSVVLALVNGFLLMVFQKPEFGHQL